MSEQPYRVLLADLKDANITAEVPFLFHRAGVSFDVYCSKHSWLLKSRYRKIWHQADTTSTESYAKGLSRLAATGRYAWIVFLDDFSLRAAHDHLDDETARNILPVTDLSHKALTSSKVALSVLSEQYGITTPRFAVHKVADSIIESAQNVPYPLLLKVDRSGGGKGIRFCASRADLARAYESIPADSRDNLLIQEYITGENISCEALFHNGKLIAHARARVLKNLDNEFSISCIREYHPDKTFEIDLVKIGSTLGLNGFCSFTFIYDKTSGIHYLVEADLRTHAWFALSRFAGVDFSEAIRHRAFGSPFMQSPRIAEVRYFSRDIVRSALSGDFANMWDWICNKDGRWRFIPTHDLRLLLATLTDMARTISFSFKALRPVGRVVLKPLKIFG